MSDLTKLDVRQIVDGIKDKQFSCAEITSEYLKKISLSSLNEYITVCKEDVISKAQKLDNSKDKNGILFGVPFCVKDNICTRGIKTTCASKMLSDFVPVGDAFCVSLLNDSGALLLGKTNMDEFAMGSTSEISFFGTVKNPINQNFSTGGSSGGSAASVSAFTSAFSLGSDTGGSIRQPSALCSVVGLKPTYSLISRNGLIAYASSLDTIGPITRTVYDSALILSVLAKHDANDSTSRASLKDTHYTLGIEDGVKGLKIGVPEDIFFDGVDEDIIKAVTSCAEILKRGGAQIVPIKLYNPEITASVYSVISCAEASSNLARYDAIRYGYCSDKKVQNLDELYCLSRSDGFGEVVKKRILFGTYVLSQEGYEKYYKKAVQIRSITSDHYRQVFSVCDCILCPTYPKVSLPLGYQDKNPYLSDIFTVFQNLCHLPAISLSVGKTTSGFPVSVQLTSNSFREDLLFKSAYFLEQYIKGGVGV